MTSKALHRTPRGLSADSLRTPVFPVRAGGMRTPATLLVIVLLVFAFVMMRLQVQKNQYATLIHRQQERVEMLRGDVARLNARLAGQTSLLSIRQRALEMGMIDASPETQPLNLLVTLTPDELSRIRAAAGAAPLEVLLPWQESARPTAERGER